MANRLQQELLSGSWPDLRRTAAHTVHMASSRFLDWLQDNWFRMLLLALLVWILLRKDLTVQLSLENAAAPTGTGHVEAPPAASGLANPPAGVLSAGLKQQQAYVERFAGVAQTEMRTFGIPASITLAQGLLESNAGVSPLATRNNNHFGIKCFRRDCRRGHCSNFADDSHKDFFRIYPSAWESFRGHSHLLRSDRYRPLFRLDRTDYRAWARGLAQAGYATDDRYADKLIDLIERLELHRYDG